MYGRLCCMETCQGRFIAASVEWLSVRKRMGSRMDTKGGFKDSCNMIYPFKKSGSNYGQRLTFIKSR